MLVVRFIGFMYARRIEHHRPRVDVYSTARTPRWCLLLDAVAPESSSRCFCFIWTGKLCRNSRGRDDHSSTRWQVEWNTNYIRYREKWKLKDEIRERERKKIKSNLRINECVMIVSHRAPSQKISFWYLFFPLFFFYLFHHPSSSILLILLFMSGGPNLVYR